MTCARQCAIVDTLDALSTVNRWGKIIFLDFLSGWLDSPQRSLCGNYGKPSFLLLRARNRSVLLRNNAEGWKEMTVSYVTCGRFLIKWIFFFSFPIGLGLIIWHFWQTTWILQLLCDNKKIIIDFENWKENEKLSEWEHWIRIRRILERI